MMTEGWVPADEASKTMIRGRQAGCHFSVHAGDANRLGRLSPSRRRRVALSQEIARQKVRRLCRWASAATPRSQWLSAVIASGIASNLALAQSQLPMLPPLLPTQSAAAPATLAVPSTLQLQKLAPEHVLRWLDQSLELAKKKDLQGAAVAFAEALRGRENLPPNHPQIEAKIREFDLKVRAEGVEKQRVIAARKSLQPIEASIASLVGQTASGAYSPTRAVVNNSINPIAQMPPSANNAPTSGAVPSGVIAATGSIRSDDDSVQSGVFNPGQDASQVQAAASQSELRPTPVPDPTSSSGASGDELYRQGMQALSEGNRDKAIELFKQAWQYQGELDPALRIQIKDKLMGLQSVQVPRTGAEEVAASPIDNVDQESLTLRTRLISEITGEIARAEAERDANPQVVAERLQALRVRVSEADLDGAARKQMLSIVDRAITSHQLYMTQNRAAIDQNMRNRQINEQVSLQAEERAKVDQQIASLVETFNDLMDERRIAEAEVVAKQVGQLDPNSTIAAVLYQNARLQKRIVENERLKAEKEDLFADAMFNAESASKPFDDRNPLLFPDAKTWEAISQSRARFSKQESKMSPAEARIWEQLRQPVSVDFQNRPLSEVIKTLSEATGIPIHINQAALAAQGIKTDQPINLSLQSMITVRSALNLLLNEHGLDYDVQNDVLLITAAGSSAKTLVSKTYKVADLVLPIPNFITDYNSGMGGAIRSAYESLGRGLIVQNGSTQANPSPTQYAAASMNPNANVLGQVNPGGVNPLPGGIIPWPVPGNGGGPVFGFNPAMGYGTSGAFPANQSPIGGGASAADFDTLITLIQQTIDPDTWSQNGGASTLNSYPGNLSLVVSAPQTTHERIADLLEALRQLQDLQVTIEVKFITLTDNFFERIGLDFDLKIDDNVRELPPEDQGNSVAIGLGSNFTNNFTSTADLDLTFRQGGFTSAVPAFGGFDPATAGTFGFAILSDLEAFFFMEAAQGDQRTNVLQAPRVTMFDGQFATINDTVQRPFVTGLTPVVADFAVAQQPVITVLNEGIILNVQSVVSQDKQYVRMTLNPTFSRIDRVDTFTFEGTETSRNGTNVLDPTGKVTGQRNNEETIVTGTTVQQPSVASTSVTTTVSVPDGGTILLGGIKRMREGRIERGIPILSKIPYVNRLFKNTSVGRETSTLMMTVTPRIIIQEESEDFLAGGAL